MYVSRAVLWHELADRLEVRPEVPVSLVSERVDDITRTITTHTIASTTAEDAYPAWNNPGLLPMYVSADLLTMPRINHYLAIVHAANAPE